MRLASNCDALLLHRLQQSGLSLRGSPVDLIGQYDMGKDRALLKFKDFSPRRIIRKDIRAGDIGRHQIRGELNAREGQVQYLAQTPHYQSLAQSRHPFQETMTAANQGDKKLLDQLLVAYNRPAYLRLHLFKGMARARHSFSHLRQNFHDHSPLLLSVSPRERKYLLMVSLSPSGIRSEARSSSAWRR